MIRQITALAFAATLAAGTLAQSSTTINAEPTNLCVRGGAFFPVESKLRDVEDIMFGLGLDFIFDQQFISGSTTYLSVDWIGRTLKGDKGNIFPICLNQKFPLAASRGLGSYAFVGAGVSLVDINKSDSAFALRGGLGLDLGASIFAEGTFYWSDDMKKNPRATGIGVYLGYRW